MANAEHLKIFKQGMVAWNAWRNQESDVQPDLNEADLANEDLSHFDLHRVTLRNADLTNANFFRVDLANADVRKARMVGASLNRADLIETDLRAADLTNSSLFRSNVRAARMEQANLSEARLLEMVFSNVDLTDVYGLESCRHSGPSTIDHRTLLRSTKVPIKFWRGCGLPDALIDYMPSFAEDAIQFYSCFISYSSKDQEFADRLHADLQDNGVRCWFAPHDLPIGAKTRDGIDEAIRSRDKVLLILSDGAIGSDWVEDEVTTAFAEERRRRKLVLFPVRLDDVVMETDEPWAGKLRDNRNIGDFSRWKEHDAYRATFKRVLRDLRAER